MRRIKYVLLWAIVLGFSAIIVACSEPVVNVDIGDPVAREKYLNTLIEKNIKYEVDINGEIKVYMDYDELEEQMADYEKWQKEYWKKQGFKVME